MASPTPAQDQAVAAGGIPVDAPLSNPPATLDQIATNHADRARAAVGGTAAAGAAPEPMGEEGEPRAMPRPQRGDRLKRSARFEPPTDLDFELEPSATGSQQIPNSNVPLTVGLMLSIVAAFVVFFISLAADNSGGDPIMPAFWRGLAALAVLMTLSFAASWFMPAPVDHRTLLDQIDAQDRAMGHYQAPPPKPREPAPAPSMGSIPGFDDEDDFDFDKGSSVDVMLQDDFADTDEDLTMAPSEDDDLFDDEDDFASTPAAFGSGE